MVLDEGTTNKFDFPSKGMVSGLLIHRNVTNAVDLHTYEKQWAFQRAKDRLVGNGNVDIANLEERHLAAIDLYETGKTPNLGLTQAIGGVQSSDLLLMFGRYMGDPKYGLDLGKFGAGVEFIDENSFSTSYYTDASCMLTVWALMRKNPEAGLFSGGYFRKRQIVNKDAASATQYKVKMPTENKIRQIHMFSEEDISSYVRATGGLTTLQTVWLGINSKEEQIINSMTTTQLSRFLASYFGLQPITKGYFKDDASGTYFETCIHDLRESVYSVNHSNIGVVKEDGNTWLDSVSHIQAYDMAGSAYSQTGIIVSKGQALSGWICLLLTDPVKDDETSFLDAKALADVDVEFTEGNSAGNTYIVLDELERSYPSG
jgi:hypothetical protein